MRKLKERDRRSKLLTRVFIPWFGLPQRHTYIHVVEALTKSIASRQSSLFRRHRVTTVILIPGTTKELVHEGRGSPRPPHKDRSRRSTPSRRVVDVASEPQSSKEPALQDIFFVHKRTTTQRHKALLSHSLKELTFHNTLKVC